MNFISPAVPPATKRSLVIPAHNEEATIGAVVRSLRASVDEVIVVASACRDNTIIEATTAGAQVIREERVGKHFAVRAGLLAARGEYVSFVDGDLIDPPGDLVDRLFTAMTPGVLLAKGFYHRAPDGEARLTEICARPLLAIVRPDLMHMRDPLSGEYAVVRSRARHWSFSPGFAVDLGFLVAAAREGAVVEVDLGIKRHRHRSVHALGQAAVQIAASLLRPAENGSKVIFTQPVDGLIRRADVDVCPLSAIDEGASE